MKNKILTIMVMIAAIIVSCRDNSLLPVDFHSINNDNGAYLRTISIPSAKFDLTQFANSYYEIIYEAGVVNISKFQSVSLTLQFQDNTKANGTYKRAPVKLPDLPASAWTVDATSKLPRFDFKITGPEALAAVNLPIDSVTFGDSFQIVETINYDGGSWSFDNTSADLTGGPFYTSPFLHVIGTGDPLSISMTWDGGKGYCKSIDLDLYFTDNDGNEIDNYAAASSACPEKTSLSLSSADGSYWGYVNPYDYGTTATAIPASFTFSQPGKTSLTFNLVDETTDAQLLISTAATPNVFYAKNGGAFITYTGFQIIKTGPNFDVYDGAGVKKGSFGL